MKKLFTEDQLRELLGEPEFKSFESLLFGPNVDCDQSINIPDCWKELVRDDNLKGNLSKYWLVEGTSFDDLAAMLEKKVHQITVAKFRGKNEYALLYFFLQKGKLRTWIGHMPLDKLPVALSNQGIDLIPLYRIHNGFYNLSFGEPGFLPVERIEIYQNKDEPEQKRFLKLFEQGASVMGIDLESEDNHAYIIWSSDEEIEEVDSIWTELDSWLTDIIEEYDDVSEKGNQGGRH